MASRLDFRHSLESGLRSSPRRDGNRVASGYEAKLKKPMQCMSRSIKLCRQLIRIRPAYESVCYIPKNPFVFSASHVQLNSIVFQFIDFDILIDHCRHYPAKEIYLQTVCTGQRNLQVLVNGD